MKKAMIFVCLISLSSGRTLAGDDVCYGYTSTTSHFSCNISPYNSGNCTWWAASKRSDIAVAITESGWNGGQWYDKLKNISFPTGSVPSKGSIVEFSIPGHVAYVENVYGDGSFDVSEMDAYNSEGFVVGVNYASYSPNPDGTYNRNGGTKKWILKGFIYGKDPNTISGNTFTVRRVGNYAWYPAYASCIHAEAWYGLDSGRQIVRSYDSGACQWIYEDLYPQEVSYDALFGDANACYQ